MLTPACVNRRFSSAALSNSSGSGQFTPAVVARFQLSWIVLRAAPSLPGRLASEFAIGVCGRSSRDQSAKIVLFYLAQRPGGSFSNIML
jgi:hypothetical protein